MIQIPFNLFAGGVWKGMDRKTGGSLKVYNKEYASLMGGHGLSLNQNDEDYGQKRLCL